MLVSEEKGADKARRTFKELSTFQFMAVTLGRTLAISFT